VVGGPPVLAVIEGMSRVRAESFPRELRLRRRAEFRAVQERGRKVHTPHFLLFALDGAPGEPRLGITASRKVGSAVVRNQLKRYLREVFRRHRDEFPRDKAVVVLVKHAAAELGSQAVAAEILRASRRL
jgi:ribonuclease P protein component